MLWLALYLCCFGLVWCWLVLVLVGACELAGVGAGDLVDLDGLAD